MEKKKDFVHCTPICSFVEQKPMQIRKNNK